MSTRWHRLPTFRFTSIRLGMVTCLFALALVPGAANASTSVIEPDPNFGQQGFTRYSPELLQSETTIRETVIDGEQRTISLVQVDGSGTFLTRHNTDGTMDSTFGSNGRTAKSTNMWVSGIQLLSNGKIIEIGGSDSRILLRRRLANGQIDTTFGTNGISQSPSFGTRGFASEPILYVNKINNQNNVYVGVTVTSNIFNNNHEVILSFDGDGNLNGDFGMAGFVVLNPVQTSESCLTSLADLAMRSFDGKLLVLINGCNSNIAGFSHSWVYRLDGQTGNVDTTFGDGGVKRISSATETEFRMTEMILDANDSIYLFGASGTYYSGPWSVASAKLLSNGSLSGGYGTSGIAVSTITDDGEKPQITEPVLLSNGNIVIGVTVNIPGRSTGAHKSYLLQFTSLGSLDTSTFNSAGQIVVNVSQGETGLVQSLARRSDGSFILGFARKGTRFNAELLRLRTDATFDLSYRSNNLPTFVSNELSTSLNSVHTAVQSDGKIVVAVSADQQMAGNDVRVIRFLPTGERDISFGNQGTRVIFPDEIGVAIRRVMISSNGDIYVVTVRDIPSSNDRQLTIFRMSSNGTLDISYGTNGMATNAVPTNWIGVDFAEIQEDGKLLIVSNVNCDIHLTRFLSNGGLDASFDGASGSGNGDVVIAGFCSSAALLVNGNLFISGVINQSTVASVMKIDLTGQVVLNFGTQGVQSFPESDGNSGQREGYIYQMVLLSNGNILGVGESGRNGTYETALYAMSQDGVLDQNFDGAAGPGNGIVYFQPVNGTAYSSWTHLIVNGNGVVLFNVEQSNAQHQIVVRRISNNGVIDTTYGNGGANQIQHPVRATNTWIESVKQMSNGKYFGIGMQETENFSDLFLFQFREYVAPTTTTTSPVVSTPATTVPPVAPVANSGSSTPELALGKLVSRTSLLKKYSLTVPKGGKVSMTATTPKTCKVIGTSIKGLAKGTCSVRFTITPAKGATKKYTKTLKIS